MAYQNAETKEPIQAHEFVNAFSEEENCDNNNSEFHMDYNYADADDIYVYWKKSDMLRRKYNSRNLNSHFDTFVQAKLMIRFYIRHWI